MADLYQRWAYHHSISFHIKRRTKLMLDLADALEILSSVPDTERAFVTRKDNDSNPVETICLKDINLTLIKGKAVLLFTRINRNESPVLGNENTYELRAPDRQPGEHGGGSAHLVFDLERTEFVYPAVLEKSPGLSPTSISMLMINLINKYIDYSDEQYGTNPTAIFRLNKVADLSLMEDLAEGEIKAVELKRVPTPDELEAADDVHPRQVIMRFTIDRETHGQKAISFVNRMLSSPIAREYNRLHIAYTDKRGEHRSGNIVTDPDTHISNTIHRHTLLDPFTAPLPSDPKAVIPELAHALGDLLNEDNDDAPQ